MEARTLEVPRQFDVVIERDSEGYYVASVPQIPGCHTQARSLDEVTERIREAIALCLEVEGAPEQELEFVGIQRVTIAAGTKAGTTHLQWRRGQNQCHVNSMS